MTGWLLICAGLGVAYGACCLLQEVARRKRVRRDREELLRKLEDERIRRWGRDGSGSETVRPPRDEPGGRRRRDAHN
jgi:hypothetical protein